MKYWQTSVYYSKRKIQIIKLIPSLTTFSSEIRGVTTNRVVIACLKPIYLAREIVRRRGGVIPKKYGKSEPFFIWKKLCEDHTLNKFRWTSPTWKKNFIRIKSIVLHIIFKWAWRAKLLCLTSTTQVLIIQQRSLCYLLSGNNFMAFPLNTLNLWP